MENKVNELFYKFIKDDEFICQNMRQISIQIKKIKKKYFENTKDFTIRINYFKKISKESTTVQLIINNYIFEFLFLFSFLSKETKKEQRRNFASNLLDEIIENFPGYSELKFFSDNLNQLSGYTFKCLIKESTNVKSLELHNFLIIIDKENTELLKMLRNFKNMDNITLFLNYNILDSKNFLEIFNFLFQQTSIKRANLHFYFKQLDIMSFFDKILLNLPKGISVNNLSELNLNMVKFHPEKSILVSEKQRGLIVPIFLVVMNKYWPSYFDFNYNEIVYADSIYSYKKINVKYTKDFFINLNIIKDIVLAKYTRKFIDTRFFSVFSTFSHLSFSSDKMFKPTFANIGLSFPDLNQINLQKWTFDFIHELEAYSKRKYTCDDIMLILNTRRKIYDNFSD